MGKNGIFWRVNPYKSVFLSFSKTHVAGTLNLYLRTSDSMQKELAQSDHPVLRKRPKTDDLTNIQNVSTFRHIMNVFSVLSYPIELIPFALSQTFWDTSLEYPQHAFLRNSKNNFYKGLPFKKYHFYPLRGNRIGFWTILLQ